MKYVVRFIIKDNDFFLFFSYLLSVCYILGIVLCVGDVGSNKIVLVYLLGYLF